MLESLQARWVEDVAGIVKRAAPEQGGVLSGINPVKFTTTDPIRLWIIQIGIILALCQVFAVILARIKQPRVIAEVIVGVILGPTAMGRIPNFTASIFPPESIPYLSLTATIGLVLFMFLTALEVDVRIAKRNAKQSLMISLAGIILPFGAGAALAIPLYNNYVDHKFNIGYFILFVGVAMSITAFPVLCRILTELRLLETQVGIVVLSAGVGNDVIGWVLLALTVALVNASGGLVALYVLLTSVAWTLFMLYPVRWAFRYLAKVTGSLETGQPTPLVIMIILTIVFVSAFMTDILGVHAIFGAFIAGLIVPHDNGFAIALVEKMEDLVVLLLVPIYFTLSGLKTNLGLLNSGKVWGYTILICVVAFVGKFFGCVAAARIAKFNWRESSTIGVLMSCKGLVELIVLNIGLQAGILNTQTFSMFVVMALVVTFITSPVTEAIYPMKYRIPARLADVSKPPTDEEEKRAPHSGRQTEDDFKSRFSVVLSRIEHLPAIMTLTQLLHKSSSSVTLADPTSSSEASGSPSVEETKISLHALRLIELTNRTSAVMQSSEAEEIMHRDAPLTILRTYGHLNSIPVSTSISVVSAEQFPTTVSSHVREKDSEMVIIPWHVNSEATAQSAYNPFESIFGAGSNTEGGSTIYTHFLRQVFSTAPTDVGLFVDRGISAEQFGQHILLPFMGGPDDRLALSFVVQLCTNPSITATVIRIKQVENDIVSGSETTGTDLKPTGTNLPSATVMSTTGFPDTIYAPQTTQTRMESVNADSLLLARYAHRNGEDALPASVEDALSRITFEDLVTPVPLTALIKRVNETNVPKKSVMVVTGRGRRMAVESHHAELRTILHEYAARNGRVGGDASRTLGDVATALMMATKANILVVQAALPSIQE